MDLAGKFPLTSHALHQEQLARLLILKKASCLWMECRADRSQKLPTFGRHTDDIIAPAPARWRPLFAVSRRNPTKKPYSLMLSKKHHTVAIAVAVVTVVVLIAVALAVRRPNKAPVDIQPTPVMSVVLTRPVSTSLPMQVPATGNVTAWQEASIGAETEGLRLSEVHVNVGDEVHRGQVLAVFDADLVAADFAEARAAAAVAEAEAREAETNAQRARKLDGTGAMSSQQISGYLAAAAVAHARLKAARAVEQRHRLRLAHTRVLAPSDGIITSRTATVGAVMPAGQELFRMIKDGRLEWRAVVAVADLDKLVPGQMAVLQVSDHPPVRGRVRMLAPDINTDTHSGLVYVDLPKGSLLRAGSFVTGHIDVSAAPALMLPLSSVLLRDGFHYAMQVGPASNVVMKKVSLGRRQADHVEITSGLALSDTVIASGLSFLGEGDTVRVVSRPPRVNATTNATVNAATGASLGTAP